MIEMSKYYKIGDYIQVNPHVLLKIITIEHILNLVFCKEYHYSTHFISELTCMGNELKVFHYDDIKDCEIVSPEPQKDMNFNNLEFGA